MTDIGRILSCSCICAALAAQGDTLSLKSYVLLSLKNSPQYAIATSSIDASRAARQAALSKLIPSVNGNAGLSRSESTGGALKSGRSPGGDVNSASVGVNGQVLLYDFGKTPMQYQATEKSEMATELDLKESIASIILNARTAYFNYLLSEQLLIVNEDALKQARAHFTQAQTLFEVGKQAKIAVTNARVDVANARVNVIHAQNAIKLAKVQMETIAAKKLGDQLTLIDSLNVIEDSIAENEAEKRALESRPEILSAQEKLEAAKLQARAVKASYLPSLNASGSLGWDAQDNGAITGQDWNASPNWSIGASLSVPLYQGGAIRAQVAQANAALAQSKAQLDAVTLTVTQQIHQFYLQETDARQRIIATAEVIDQANENLQLTQERYKAGLGTSVDLTDAEQSLANARSSHIQALFDYRVAHANLLLAIGELKE